MNRWSPSPIDNRRRDRGSRPAGRCSRPPLSISRGRRRRCSACRCHLVELSAHVLDPRDPRPQQLPVAGLPYREILDGLPPGFRLVFFEQVRKQRTVALGPDGRGHRVIGRLKVAADHLDALLPKPGSRFLIESRRVAEIFEVVPVLVMPAGVDDDDVAGPYLRPGALQILRRDDLPLALGYGDGHSGAEEGLERKLVDELLALDDVRGGVHMRRAVHDGRDALGQDAGFGVVMDSLGLDVLKIGPVGDAVTPRVAQIIELQTGRSVFGAHLGFLWYRDFRRYRWTMEPGT